MAIANRVRIIGGIHRRRLIAFPDAGGLRPTPDRVRETLFNWLGQTLEGKDCLDLFAGAGALGFEAASREAGSVVMVERDERVFKALSATAEALKTRNVELVRGDALEYVARNRRKFHVVFLDPPYQSGLLAKVLPEVGKCLAADGQVYAESGTPLEPGPEWTVWRQGKAGSVYYYLLRPADGRAGITERATE